MRGTDVVSLIFQNCLAMRYIILLYSFFNLATVSAQNTFWKYLDMSGDGSEEPYDMEIRNDTVFIWGLGTCGEERCMHYYQFNIDGDLLLSKDYPGVIPGRRVTFLDDIFYLPIRHLSDNNQGADGFRLGKYDLKGNLLSTVKYDLNDHADSPVFDADYYFSYGSIAYADHILIYGEVLDEQVSGQKRQTCMFWYNEVDLSLDTIIFIDPKEEVIDTWDAAIDQNGLLTLLVEYRERLSDGKEEDHIVYVKYNEDGQLADFWDGPVWSGRYAHNSLVISNANDIIMPFEQLDAFISSDVEVKIIDTSGNTKWREEIGLKNVPIGERGYLDLMQSSDGHIVGCGRAASAIAEFDGAHIFKLDYTTGAMLWDRAYSDWILSTGLRRPKYMFLFNVEELSDGSFFACGLRRRSIKIDGVTDLIDDLLLIRVDADGCLEPGCGGTKQALSGVPAYDLILSPESLWYYQKFGSESGMVKKTYRWTDISPDTIILEGSTTEYLDPREHYQYTDFDFLFSVSEGGRKIYVGENREELLYDFSLEVGDIFTSDYTEHPLEVIESDTMRLSNKAKRRYWVLACMDNPENTITWIDGIGSYYGVLWPKNFCEGDYGDKKLTCFYRFERLAHMNPDVGGCLLPSSTDDRDFLILSAITAYPNPTQDHVTLTAPPDLLIDRLELLDTQGRTHNSFYENSSEVRLDLSGYPSGLYFVSIYTEKGRVVKKVVLE